MNNFVSDSFYKKVTDNFPIVCVDIIPISFDNDGPKVGVILRATGSEKGKFALLGGRVQYGERLDQAIKRHLLADLGIKKLELITGNTISRPFYVQQYDHAPTSQRPYGYDPSKQAIGLTYLISINGRPVPRQEASDFKWLADSAVPVAMAYNQQTVINEAFKFIHSSKHG